MYFTFASIYTSGYSCIQIFCRYTCVQMYTYVFVHTYIYKYKFIYINSYIYIYISLLHLFIKVDVVVFRSSAGTLVSRCIHIYLYTHIYTTIYKFINLHIYFTFASTYKSGYICIQILS